MTPLELPEQFTNQFLPTLLGGVRVFVTNFLPSTETIIEHDRLKGRGIARRRYVVRPLPDAVYLVNGNAVMSPKSWAVIKNIGIAQETDAPAEDIEKARNEIVAEWREIEKRMLLP